MFITRAAIMYSNGGVLGGWNYQAIRQLAGMVGHSGDYINGFLTNSDEFVLPKDAAAIALNSGQIKKPLDELSPDDLWPTLSEDL